MNDAAAIELLRDLVAIPSPSCNEARAVRFLVERMGALGFDAEIDAMGNAVGRIGSQGPRLALVGHIDTVPGHVPVRIEQDRLYGRGSVDAKGCLATFIVATLRAARAGTLAARIEIVGCVEEEVPSSLGAHHRATFPAPDALIVGEPSGAHAITTGYKGFVRARQVWTEELAHTAGPGPGAAARACRHFVGLESAAASIGAGSESICDQLSLHLAALQASDDGLHATAELDLRLRLPETLMPTQAMTWLEEHSPGWRTEAIGGVPAWFGPRTGPLARHLGRAIARRGARPRFQRKTGTADLNVLAPAWGCPAVAYGPGDSALDHTPNEHLALAEYRESLVVLEALVSDPALDAALTTNDSAIRCM